MGMDWTLQPHLQISRWSLLLCLHTQSNSSCLLFNLDKARIAVAWLLWGGVVVWENNAGEKESIVRKKWLLSAWICLFSGIYSSSDRCHILCFMSFNSFLWASLFPFKTLLGHIHISGFPRGLGMLEFKINSKSCSNNSHFGCLLGLYDCHNDGFWKELLKCYNPIFILWGYNLLLGSCAGLVIPQRFENRWNCSEWRHKERDWVMEEGVHTSLQRDIVWDWDRSVQRPKEEVLFFNEEIMMLLNYKWI